MYSNTPLFLFSVFWLYAVVDALPYHPNDTINWYSCKQNGSVPLTCGTLTVPLDYSNPLSNKTLDLALVRVNATKTPKKGSILFNPGGPGQGGRDFIVGPLAVALLNATGGSYDLISFDPRGTGNTIPFSCYSNSTERSIASSGVPGTTNSSDAALGAVWASLTILAETCLERNKDIGELMGTPFVARDMIRIVDALHEDGLLRYWGFSYGTLLGVTVASMFPERMDKIILDGVVNPHEYYAGLNVQELTNTDDVLAGFFQGCIADPDNCALAKDAKTAEELSQKIYGLINTLKYNPIVAGSGTSALIINYDRVKTAIFDSLYSTKQWPSLASALHGLLTGNSTAILSFLARPDGAIYPTYGPEANLGIRCSDSALRSHNLTELAPLIAQDSTQSTIVGDLAVIQLLACAQWPFRAKERSSADFHVKTKTPILFIGNTFDNITPLVSARNASAGFEDSIVLQHNGYGHSSISQPSLCTARAIRTYFQDGVLPLPGTICEPSVTPFENWTYAGVYGGV